MGGRAESGGGVRGERGVGVRWGYAEMKVSVVGMRW